VAPVVAATSICLDCGNFLLAGDEDNGECLVCRTAVFFAFWIATAIYAVVILVAMTSCPVWACENNGMAIAWAPVYIFGVVYFPIMFVAGIVLATSRTGK